MKPIKLTLQAFGPFVDKEVIDFTRFGNNPLFLINGPTGSGKSTILDAICFALYGATTGAERDASQMRCDHADPKTLTQVTLDFSLGDKAYRIKRTPAQERAKARGEGLTSHAGSAELHEIDVTGELNLIVAKKIKQATDEVESITGLNVEQFRQVMVLPQGKFRELLLANSSDRQQIFCRLFQTRIYQRIEDTLKQKSKLIRENVTAHHNKIKGILEGADLHTEAEVHDSIDKLAPQLENAKSKKDVCNDIYLKAVNEKEAGDSLLQRFSELEKTRLAVEEKNNQKPEFDQKQRDLDHAELANKIKPVFDDLSRVSDEKHLLTEQIESLSLEINDVERKYSDAETTLIQCKAKTTVIDGLKLDINKLNRFTDKVDELESLIKKYRASNQVYGLSKKALIDAQSAYDAKTKAKEMLQKTISRTQKTLSESGDKVVRLQTLDAQLKQRKDLDGYKQRYNNIKIQIVSAKQKIQDQQGVFEKSSRHANKQEMHWHAGQAAILAQQLQDGVPCPVCGSEDHPAPAITENKTNVVSKQQMEQARDQSDQDRDCLQSVKDSLTELNSQFEPLEISIKQMQAELAEVAEKSVADLTAAYRSLKHEVEQLDTSRQQLAKDENNLLQHNSEIETLLKVVNQCKEKLDTDKILVTQDRSAVTHMEKELPQGYRDKATLQAAMQKLEAKLQSLTENLNQAQKNYDQCKEQVTTQIASLQTLNKRHKSLAKQEIKCQEKWRATLNASAFQSRQQYQDSILGEAEVTALSSEISDYHEQLNQLKGAFKQQQEALIGNRQPDINALIKLCDEKKQALKIAEAFWTELKSRHGQLKDVQKKLTIAHADNKKLEAEYAIYGTLSKVANGHTGNKISLQRFVLGVLLDDVLIEASAKLYDMTNGRYQLLRKQDRSKGGGASGLELDVEDAYTGKTRSVATLSGGESFMAALALALGLSDVVQAYAGGIRLDALFIDEGFGSLDPESLDLAIKTLVDLQASGRMIGIISHVSELKEQMAMRLDVISTKTGSSIKTFAA